MGEIAQSVFSAELEVQLSLKEYLIDLGREGQSAGKGAQFVKVARGWTR